MLAKAIKLIEFTQADADSAVSLVSIQQKYSDMQTEMREQSKELDELRARYKGR